MRAAPKLTKKSPGAIRAFINEELIPWAKSGRAVGSELCDVDERDEGTQIIPRATGKGAAAKRHPLEVVVAANGVRIFYGLVAGRSDPFSPGDNPPYTLAAANGDKIIAGLTQEYDAVSGSWQTTAIYFISQPTVPPGDVTNAYYEIGSISEGGAVVSAVNGGIAHQRCGDGTTFADVFFAAP